LRPGHLNEIAAIGDPALQSCTITLDASSETGRERR
jgi:hypothetical protein